MACKKTKIRRLCVATSGACALAFATSALHVFDSTREIAVGQTPPDVQASDSVSSNASLPSASDLTTELTTAPKANLDPFNLSVGAKSGAASPNVASPGLASPGDSQLASLRSQMQALQSRLQKTPTSLEEQNEQRQIINELASIQAQIQRLEATTGNFAAYRQARDLQAGLLPPNDPTTAMNAMTQGYNRRDAFDANASAGISREQILNASGLDSNVLAARFGGAQISEAEAGLLREQKEGLTQQYRQIQQTLRALQPGDEALATNLRQEQATILEQLKEIDSKLSNAPQAPTVPPFDAASDRFNADQFSVPPANRLPNFTDATTPLGDLAARMQKVNQAAQLLREAGLVQLANYAANEAPRLADPNFVETSLTPGAWSESDGLAETRNNPFQQITPRDLEKITSSVDELKAKIDALTETATNVEAQLKLLTRVSGYVATPEGAPTPIDVPTQEDAPKEEAPTSEDATPNENPQEDEQKDGFIGYL